VQPHFNKLLSNKYVSIVQIAAGNMHCLALTRNNAILSWGFNGIGALGRGTCRFTSRYRDWVDVKGDTHKRLNVREGTPGEVKTSSLPKGIVFTQVVAGNNVSFAITDDGQVYGWGSFQVSSLVTRWL
jgi:regulator of chromosome condensation